MLGWIAIVILGILLVACLISSFLEDLEYGLAKTIVFVLVAVLSGFFIYHIEPLRKHWKWLVITAEFILLLVAGALRISEGGAGGQGQGPHSGLGDDSYDMRGSYGR